MKIYTLTLNRQKKTYTIRVYANGKLSAKYRSYPQGKNFSEFWTQSDIIAFLKYSNDYYIIK
jgi:hypothetical protein